MKTIKILFIISSLLLVFTGSFAQTTTSDKIIKTGNDLKTIFGKKEKPQTTSGQKAGGEKNKNASTQSSANTNELKPGDVHPNAKYLDVDYMSKFNSGAAVVKKGDSYALIDSTGNFIVPFNKYIFTNAEVAYTVGRKGLFLMETQVYIENRRQKGVINAKGKVFMFDKSWVNAGFVLDGTMIKVEEPKTYTVYLVNADGIQSKLKAADSESYKEIASVGSLSEGLWICRETNLKRGYKNINNEWVIKPQFDEVDHFSSGVAIVGKTNEFGEKKYGVIDRAGNQVVPFIYSTKPGRFIEGFTIVYPRDKSEFEYAVINRAGKIVIKQTRKDLGNFWCFYNGYAFLSGYVMDTTGILTSNSEFLMRYGYKPKNNGLTPSIATPMVINADEYNDGKIYTQNAIIDISTKATIDGPFSTLYFNGAFDKVSKLAYTQYSLGRDQQNKLVYREGYINEQGIFMIVKGPGSKW